MNAVVSALAAAEPVEPWPELIAFGTAAELPPIDAGALPAPFGPFAEALAAFTETPLELPASIALAVAATCAARRLVIEGRPGYREPCCLWTVCALEPANRKSAVFSAAAEPLTLWERQAAEEIGPKVAAAREERQMLEARAKGVRRKYAAPDTPSEERRALLEEAADLRKALPEVPTVPRLWTSDATPEKVGMLLAEQEECMAVLSAEGGIFDVLGGRYSKNGTANLDLFLKAHAGDAERVDRVGREPVVLERPRLTLGLAVQPAVLEALAEQGSFSGRGLLARALWFRPVSPVGRRTFDGPDVPEPVRAAYARCVTTMLEWPAPGPGECHVLRLEDGARREWREFALELERRMAPGGALELHRSWAGKAPGAALRVAALLHGIEHAEAGPWSRPIGEATMGAALALLGVAMAHSTAVLADIEGEPGQADARHLLGRLRGLEVEAATVRELHRATQARFKTAKTLRTALDVLEERGYVRVLEPEPSGRGGGRRPSPIVQVRPS